MRSPNDITKIKDQVQDTSRRKTVNKKVDFKSGKWIYSIYLARFDQLPAVFFLTVFIIRVGY